MIAKYTGMAFADGASDRKGCRVQKRSVLRRMLILSMRRNTANSYCALTQATLTNF